MTAISAVVSNTCIAVATDSFLTEQPEVGQAKIVKSKQTKLVPIPKLKSAAAYWGLARLPGWDTYKWLRQRCETAHTHGSLEAFVVALRDELEPALAGLKVRKALDRGIGIHIAGYERVGSIQVPELFLISNFKDPTYSSLCCLHATRETYGVVSGESPRPEHRIPEIRRLVNKHLRQKRIIYFNNGDPGLFNRAANGVVEMVAAGRKRGAVLSRDEPKFWLSVARRPISTVADFQRDFFKPGHRLVGGKPHDLAILPTGQMESTTGDKP